MPFDLTQQMATHLFDVARFQHLCINVTSARRLRRCRRGQGSSSCGRIGSQRQMASRQRVAQHQVLTDQAAGVGKAEQPSHPWMAYGTTVNLAMNTNFTLEEVGKQV